jgi:hypothetical protein
VLGSHAAAMLARVVGMGFELLALHVLGVELEHFRSMVVD